MQIVHLSSAHPRFDTRIFHKMCISLAANGHTVTLVVADSKGDEVVRGINILDVGASRGRLDRILRAPRRLLEKALSVNSDLYHLHDPELIPIGLKLRRLGKRVIFDSHEDVPKQMLGKPYLNKPLLWLVSSALRVYELWACRQFNGIIAATPFIRDKFLKVNSRTIDINNFPLLDELSNKILWKDKRAEVCYVGGISAMRGIKEVLVAIKQVKSTVRLNLCGEFSEPEFEMAMKSSLGWARVNERGFLDRTAVSEVLERSIAGVVTLHPAINYLDALPVKMFEYMAAGIPVIVSNFPLWLEIIQGAQCGLCVDPLKPSEIAEAIDFLLTNPNEAQRMGQNGRRAVLEQYNWSIEESKLFAFYDLLLNRVME